MANMVKNVLLVTPEKSIEGVKAFREFIDVLGGHLDFNSIVPMPSEIETQSVPFCNGLCFTTEKVVGWQYEHWGTKNGALNVYFDVARVNGVISMKVTFDTATWPAIPIVKVLASRFTDLAFELSYFDTDYPDAKWGHSIFKKGNLHEQNKHRLNQHGY